MAGPAAAHDLHPPAADVAHIAGGLPRIGGVGDRGEARCYRRPEMRVIADALRRQDRTRAGIVAGETQRVSLGDGPVPRPDAVHPCLVPGTAEDAVPRGEP